MHLTFRYRVKDSSAKRHLRRHAKAVNYVWNYCCETQRHAMKWRRKWPTAFDLMKLTSGTSKELNIQAGTINEICKAFVIARDKAKRCPRFRGKKSIGWIPFKADTIKVVGDRFIYRKREFRFWKTRSIDGRIKVGSIGSDARGRWYVNFVCEVEETPTSQNASIGIDLGLKSFATLSNGEAIPAPRIFRSYEKRLSVAQRAGNRAQAKAIQAKIANSRKDFLHKLSTRLVKSYGTIVIGDIRASRLKRTKMAKSVSDASWYAFKTMLAEKAVRHRVRFIEASEIFSSQVCSSCGARSGPKGRKDLCVRQWVCAECGTLHDRDQNAAMNILIAGARHCPPQTGIAA